MVAATVFTLTTSFSYDGLGNRHQVIVGGALTTTNILDLAASGRVLGETSSEGTTLYLYGQDCLGELRDNEWLYYLDDAQGLVRQGVDAEGQLLSTWLFNPDGAVIEGPEGPVSHLVCDGVYDWSTGLIYRNGRYFDPLLGIWLLVGGLAMFQSWPGRKRKRKGIPWMNLLFVVVLLIGVLVACTPEPGTPDPTITCTPSATLPPPAEKTGPIDTQQPDPTETQPPTDTPVNKNWLPHEFLITHYAIVMENDPYFTPGKGNIPIYKGVPGEIEWKETSVYHFVVGNTSSDTCDLDCVAWSVYVNGTGKLIDGRYLHTLDNETLYPPDFEQNAVYEYLDKPTNACATYLEKDATIAVSADALIAGTYSCGDQYYIEEYGDKVFTVTDTGSFEDEYHFDIFGGEQWHDAFYAEYTNTGTYQRVAKVQR